MLHYVVYRTWYLFEVSMSVTICSEIMIFWGYDGQCGYDLIETLSFVVFCARYTLLKFAIFQVLSPDFSSFLAFRLTEYLPHGLNPTAAG